MLDFIDLYCERLGPGLWAEPFNALTNAAFFIAAYALLRLGQRAGALNAGSALLIGGLLLIGAGSWSFHTYATRWAMMADSLSIALYQLLFIGLYARTIMQRSGVRTALTVLGFLSASFLFSTLPGDDFNGSLAYGPALIFLAGFALWHFRHAARERSILLLALGVFSLSLSLRTLDMSVCPVLPFGLHGFWHILNGVVLYLTTRAFMMNAPHMPQK